MRHIYLNRTRRDFIDRLSTIFFLISSSKQKRGSLNRHSNRQLSGTHNLICNKQVGIGEERTQTRD